MCSFIRLIFLPQDIASAIDEEDVAKFTDVVKEFDSMTTLVRSYFMSRLEYYVIDM